MQARCADFETELVEFNGENNHVHLLVNFPPKVPSREAGHSLKGVSSRRIRQEIPDLARHCHRANKLWSGSYYAGSVGGAPLTVVRQHIKQQNRPVQGTARGLGGLPARAFTPALKDEALARNPVAIGQGGHEVFPFRAWNARLREFQSLARASAMASPSALVR
jgi:putative transposase